MRLGRLTTTERERDTTMKRSELVVGQDYLANSSKDWQKYGGSARVRVLNTTDNIAPLSGWGYRRSAPEVQVDVPGGKATVKGTRNVRGSHTHVVVAEVEADGSLGTPRLLATRELRCTWEHGVQVQQQHRERVAQAARERKERDAQVTERLWNLSNRLDTIVNGSVGQRVLDSIYSARHYGTVSLRMADLEMILDACGVTDEKREG